MAERAHHSKTEASLCSCFAELLNLLLHYVRSTSERERELMAWFKALLITGILFLFLVGCNTTSTPDPEAIVIPTPTPTTVPPTPDKPTYTVRQGEMIDELELSGRVTAARNQDVFFKQDGFLEQVVVQRGDIVTQGQLLAQIDSGSLPQELSDAQSELQDIQALISHSAQERQLELRNAQLALENAQGELASVQQPAGETEISAARLAIEQAGINLEDVRRNVSTAKTSAQLAVEQAANAVRNRQDAYSDIYHDTSYQTQEDKEQDLEQARRAIQDAEANLAQANRAFEAAREAEVTSIRKAEQDLATAELKLEQLLVPPDPLEVAAAQRAVQQARVRLEEVSLSGQDPMQVQRANQIRRRIGKIRQQLEEYQLYAPFGGEVAEVIARAGDQVPAYSPVVNIMDPSDLAVAVSDFLSSDLDKITIGQEVTLTFDRYPDQPVPGRVTRLPAAQLGSGSDDATVQRDPNLWIDFDQGDMELDIGDLADVHILFAERSDALWLPSQAVRSFDDDYFVVVRDGDEERRVDVRVGIINDGKMEIIEGLSEGDLVVGP